MTETETKIAELPPLDEDQLDLACVRGPDRSWATLVKLFDRYHREQGLTYEALGKRIKRSRSHVQRWLAAPFNMSLKSLGLLAEGLDADLVIEVRPRVPEIRGTNYAHPSERAKERLQQTIPAAIGTVPVYVGEPGQAIAGSRSTIMRVRPLVGAHDG